MTAVERIQERAKSLGAYATKVAFERHEETGRYVGVVFLEMDEETTVTASAGPPELQPHMTAVEDMAIRVAQFASELLDLVEQAVERSATHQAMTGQVPEA